MRLPRLLRDTEIMPVFNTLARELERTFAGIATPAAAGIATPAAVTPAGAGDGITDDTGPLVAALAAAVSSGRPLYLGGKTWRITQRIEAIGSVAIRGPGTIYVDGNVSGGAGVDLIGTWATYNVTGAPSIVDFNLSGTSNNSNVTRIPLGSADLAAITVPCTVKVFSDDQQIGVDAGKFRGEFARAQAKDGSYLYLTARLQDEYTTNRRIAVFDKHSVNLSGFTVRGNYAAGVAGDWNYALLRLRGHLAPIVSQMRFLDGNGRGLQLQGCVGANVSDVHVSRFRNGITPLGIPGYGIQDGCGQSNNYVNITAEDCRHAWTTVHHTPTVGDVMTYGRNRGHVVTNGTALGCSAAAWDTHSDAEHCGFVNCTSYHPYSGDDAGAVGFQLRGNRCWIRNGAAIGGERGLNIIQSYNGEIGQHTVDGFITRNATVPMLVQRGANSDAGTVKATIRNAYIQAGARREVIRINNAELKLQDVTIRHSGSDDLPRALSIEASDTLVKIVAERVIYDIGPSGRTTSAFCRYDAAEVDFQAYDCGVVGGAYDCVFRASGDGPYPDVKVRFATYGDVAPTNASGIGSVGATSDVEGLVVTERLRMYGWTP